MPERTKRSGRAKKPAAGAAATAAGAAATAERPERRAEVHIPSPTAVVGEALSTGVAPRRATPDDEEIGARESELMRIGDVDADPLGNTYVGDEMPGGDMPTPDQDRVDDIGRAYGVQEVDSGALRTTSEVLDERDRKRSRLEAPTPTRGTRASDRGRGGR